MSIHNVKKGDYIISKIHSRIWINIGEVFIVEGVVVSELTGKEGVSFLDRTGSKRVFWNADDYFKINEEESV